MHQLLRAMLVEEHVIVGTKSMVNDQVEEKE